MTKENEFSKTFEEWYEWWFEKPFPTDKEEIEDLKADDSLRTMYEYTCRKISVEEEIEIAINTTKGLMDNGNLFFKDCEGKVYPISHCDVDNGKIFFME